MGVDDWNNWLTDAVEGQLGGVGLLIVLSVGVYFLTKVFYSVLRWFWRMLLRPSVNLTNLGKWSVVTGATDGIGKAMAIQLAKKGQNVVIISRTQAKLEATAQELKTANPMVEVRSIQVDFAQIMDLEEQTRIARELNGLDIGVLVNNVGISYPHAQYLEELEPVRLNQLIQLNCAGTAVMTKLVIGGMKQRRRGAIVNVSSAAGTQPQQLYIGYGASKAFVDNFSKNLKLEVAEFGIKVQSQIPLFVVSKLSKIRHASFTTPTPAGYAKWAVGQIGYDSPVIMSPYPVHSLVANALYCLPSIMVNKGIESMHKNIRRRAMKKKNKAR